MPGKAVGRAAVELPWLCPKTESLIALADKPATVAGLSATDPALAAFLYRFAQPAAEPALGGFAPGALHSCSLPETAAAYLAATSSGVCRYDTSIGRKVQAVAGRAGTFAASLAESTRRTSGEAAASVARLAPLGWYAVAAIDSGLAAEPLADPHFAANPARIQTEVWGLDQASIARRLAARWKLPQWIATTIGSLVHPLSLASHHVSHPELFAIVQLAVLEAEKQVGFLGLSQGANREELIDFLRLDETALTSLEPRNKEVAEGRVAQTVDPNPHCVPLVGNLLRMAGQSRRRNGPALVDRLEDRIDGLHNALAGLGELVGERLLSAKLDALAELAAGAGHEINNPLAVISGHAQRLLRSEQDAERGESLRAIVRQANRIAGILRDLMQFARPPRPKPQTFALGDMLLAARDESLPTATEREVHVDLEGIFAGIWIYGDEVQLRHAVISVVRNAIEAAPRGGWVRISCEAAEESSLQVVVEDNGPGLDAEAVEHAFDPFYCGRSAGRGRGLGLPTAWQLVRQNGGELRFERREGRPTRFAISLRKAIDGDLLSLRYA